ncbi:LysR family transcriptional regulator [Bacillus cereus group sp. BfR-BA-01538]|uniref:LysR family transcriptional regulator n=1 Tax=Bacillus cereus group sp. BfR-BA-01538 TaxID=2920373 RepID=UPI001F584FA7
MEIRDLQIFYTVAKHGNLSSAAKELNYVQSNITARIRYLEKELKTVLFIRYHRGVKLTLNGRRLLEEVNKLLSNIEEIKNLFLDDENKVGKLKIGTVDNIHPLPSILAEYHTKYPQVNLSLHTDNTLDLINDVLEYQLDGAFITGPIQNNLINQYIVSKKELVLISNQNTLNMELLANKNFLVFNQGCGYRTMLEKWLQDNGIFLYKYMEFNMIEMILQSVSLGLGVAVLPKEVVDHFSNIKNIYCHAIPKKYGEITTVFIWHKQACLSTCLKNLLQIIKFH